MPSRSNSPTPKTYAQLRDAVVAVVVQGRRAIDRAWLETYHETGRLINEHILQFRDRADYGAKVYKKLEDDTDINERTLRQCAQFHRYYPIRSARSELSWGHYRVLIQVEDTTRRKAIEVEAIRQHWTTRDLETRVRSSNAVALASADTAAPAPPVELLTPRRGTPGLHLVVERPDGLGIDLGFKSYADLTPDQQKRRTKGEIVSFTESGVRAAEGATKAELFTYRATIRKVIDGDTLDVAIRLAPGFTRDLKLRLRGLDCPEISTAAGLAAKAFVDALLRVGDEVIISTTKPDKYDRYLADVFIGTADTDTSESGSSSSLVTSHSSLFLNNALLSAGHAIRYDGGAKED